MVSSVSNLLGIVGADFSCPLIVADFFTYFFNVLLAFCVIAFVLHFIRYCVGCVLKGGKYL